jgi:hypothetical protein
LPVRRIRADASRHRHRPPRRPLVASAFIRLTGITPDAVVACARCTRSVGEHTDTRRRRWHEG